MLSLLLEGDEAEEGRWRGEEEEEEEEQEEEKEEEKEEEEDEGKFPSSSVFCAFFSYVWCSRIIARARSHLPRTTTWEDEW